MWMYTQVLRSVLRIAREKKIAFAGVLVLQLIVIFAFSFLLLQYQVSILSAVQQTVLPLQDANFLGAPEGEPLLQDMLPVIQGYQDIITQTSWLLLWIFLLFGIGNGILWASTHMFLRGKNVFFRQWRRFMGVTIVVLGPLFLAVYFLLRMLLNFSLTPESFTSWVQLLGVLTLVAYYISLLAFTQRGSWRQILMDSKLLVWQWRSLLVALLHVAFLAASVYLVYLSVTLSENFTFVILSTLLTACLLVLTRIVWIQYNETHHT
jgi:hypothetical protein